MPEFERATAGQIDDLLQVGGSASAADLDAARPAAALLPASVAGFLLRKRAKIIVCRNNVTDHEPALLNEHPRGWPSSLTWASVPGAYLPGPREIVVGTIDTPAGRRLPGGDTGSHGSVDLLLHEAMHGHDFLSGHRVLRDPAFKAAWTADFPLLGRYEQQPGEAGLQESYAESAARLFAGTALASQWPALFAFWHQLVDSDLEAHELELELPFAPIQLVAETPIGTATLEANETIRLDLRADSTSGAIGHAMLQLKPADEGYDQIRGTLAPEGRILESDNVGRPYLLPPFISD